MGYQLRSTIYHLLTMRGHKNFVDMMLHHVCFMLCFLYSYFTNQEDLIIGATLITCIADVFLNFGKTVRDFGLNKYFVTGSYLMILFSWLITRVIYFTYCCYATTYKFWSPNQKWPLDSKFNTLWEGTKFGWYFVMVNLSVLIGLNYFWFVCILEIGYSYIFKGGKGGFYDKRNVTQNGQNQATRDNLKELKEVSD